MQEWRDTIGMIDNKAVKLINAVEDSIYSTKGKGNFYRPCDAFLAAVVLMPGLEKSIKYHADIELIGSKTRGQMVLDHLKINKPNIQLIENIDFVSFQQLMLTALNYMNSPL